MALLCHLLPCLLELSQPQGFIFGEFCHGCATKASGDISWRHAVDLRTNLLVICVPSTFNKEALMPLVHWLVLVAQNVNDMLGAVLAADVEITRLAFTS